MRSVCPVIALWVLMLGMLCPAGFVIADEQAPPIDIEDVDPEVIRGLDIEELLAITLTPVTGVAGVPRPLLETPSAMTVITAEDIRRTGHRSLAEAMRLVPGMFVGRSASHTWRVGARGFSGGLAPRNLVLIDGRTVYDPLHGGVFWDVQDHVFEDLDHIEVIRGPGATLWGANAMNGVINVISKSAHDTQGLLLRASGGNYERGTAVVRYGDKIDEDTAFRVYGKYHNRDSFRAVDGPAEDEWSMLFGGFRLDRNIDEDTTFTVISEGYGSPTRRDAVRGEQERVFGAHLLARLDHMTEDRSGWQVQAYYDRTMRDLTAIDVRRDTFDIDFRHFFPWADGHEFIWGLNYRFTTDRSEGETVFMDPRSRDLHLAQAFVQNTFTLVPDQLFTMMGTKIGWYTYTGFEVQPGVRLWWTPDEKQTIWGAVSRPVRIPSRIEQEGTIGTMVGGVFQPIALPGEDLQAEELMAYEVGYRVQPMDDLSFDTTLFYHDYSRLISVPAETPPVPGAWNNDGRGESFGIELVADWRVADNWRLGGGYSFVRANVRGPINPFEEGSSPEHQAFIRSHYDITEHWFFDTIFYYYDNVPEANVPRYGRLDLGLTWRPSNTFEVSVWGQNINNRSVAEATTAREFPRSVFVMGTIRF